MDNQQKSLTIRPNRTTSSRDVRIECGIHILINGHRSLVLRHRSDHHIAGVRQIDDAGRLPGTDAAQRCLHATHRHRWHAETTTSIWMIAVTVIATAETRSDATKAAHGRTARQRRRIGVGLRHAHRSLHSDRVRVRIGNGGRLREGGPKRIGHSVCAVDMCECA